MNQSANSVFSLFHIIFLYCLWLISWDYLSYNDAIFCAYESGEDGLLGICDESGELCLALALWNGHDHIMKERLFGLTGPQVRCKLANRPYLVMGLYLYCNGS
jgi:hypothetical protein